MKVNKELCEHGPFSKSCFFPAGKLLAKHQQGKRLLARKTLNKIHVMSYLDSLKEREVTEPASQGLPDYFHAQRYSLDLKN